MAKRKNSFSCKGELNLGEGVVYEVKKESVDTIPFVEILKEFDGKTVRISIAEEIEIVGVEDEEENDED